MQKPCKFLLSLLILSLFPPSLLSRPVLLLLSQDHLKDNLVPSENPSDPNSDAADFDNRRDSETPKSDDDLDPGSWRPIFEPNLDSDHVSDSESELEAGYYSGIGKVMSAVSSGDVAVMEEGVGEIDAALNWGSRRRSRC